MAKIGYALSSEEHPPLDLVRYGKIAEESGFNFIMVSDHFHPWLESQGHSPFVWSVIGGLSQVTKNVRIGTGVTCPTVRTHPAVIAQAAATAACMLPGRFLLGLGTGENLNEHITGEHWPPIDIRQEMLEEATEIIRLLMGGEEENYWGNYYTVENARLYTYPTEPPPIYIAASGTDSAQLAGAIGDGLISTAPKEDLVEAYEEAGGNRSKTIGQVTVCWAEDEAEARKTAHEIWRFTALPGTLSADLPTPAHFESASKLVTEEQVAESIICGPDKKKHLEGIQEMIDAGFEEVYIHQVGRDQEGFFEFYKKNILPEMGT
ncbi:MAG: TIGR03557 family F420-dependent LLM class oxidoreductase [Chloroflexi bacterium]|nr:MAG: TIGR03557 family F420-dependent LLM class oxidoreductase [Chloroflexota bacterium]